MTNADEFAQKCEQSQKHRARFIRILRAEGFLGVASTTGPLLNAMQKIGVFRIGGTILGTQAFRLYQGELGIHYSFDHSAQTNDIDIANFEKLSLALNDIFSEPLQNVPHNFAFEAAPALIPGKVWRWKQTSSELLVEFSPPALTHKKM